MAMGLDCLPHSTAQVTQTAPTYPGSIFGSNSIDYNERSEEDEFHCERSKSQQEEGFSDKDSAID